MATHRRPVRRQRVPDPQWHRPARGRRAGRHAEDRARHRHGHQRLGRLGLGAPVEVGRVAQRGRSAAGQQSRGRLPSVLDRAGQRNDGRRAEEGGGRGPRSRLRRHLARRPARPGRTGRRVRGRGARAQRARVALHGRHRAAAEHGLTARPMADVGGSCAPGAAGVRAHGAARDARPAAHRPQRGDLPQRRARGRAVAREDRRAARSHRHGEVRQLGAADRRALHRRRPATPRDLVRGHGRARGGRPVRRHVEHRRQGEVQHHPRRQDRPCDGVFIYATVTVLNHRIGLERYTGHWSSRDGSPPPRRLDHKAETPLLALD
jgi:hypothetical protein